MKLYLHTWTVLAAVCAALGVLLAVAMLPPGLVVVVSLMVVGGVLVLTDLPSQTARDRRPLTLRRRLGLAGLLASAALALCGWGALMGALAGLLLLVLAVTAAPLAVDAAWGTRRRRPSEGAEQAPVEPSPAPRAVAVERAVREHVGLAVGSWSDDDLCRAWRASFVRLQRSTPPGRAVIAIERQIYLDEIERRYPHGFETWMRTNPRAASDPKRYLGAA
ncbi:hypothetical protein [Solicola sp. PLA-1-18]|uniref:hypothetical protein n=1 Tax=Solicola sp. PLA-1-18 TaxID=3380532 RepID=UPI003B779EBD